MEDGGGHCPDCRGAHGGSVGREECDTDLQKWFGDRDLPGLARKAAEVHGRIRHDTDVLCPDSQVEYLPMSKNT